MTAAIIRPPAPDGFLPDLNATYRDLTAQNILRDAIENQFGGRIGIVSSFGAESVILLHKIRDCGKLAGPSCRNFCTGKPFGKLFIDKGCRQGA